MNQKLKAPEEGLEYPLLLYDGVCGFCNRSVQFVIRHDSKGIIRFAPLQTDLGRKILGRHPELSSVDSVVFVEKDDAALEKAYAYSSAVIQISKYLDYPWRFIRVAAIVPTALRDFLYRVFARHRYKLFGRYDQCMMPPKHVRSRFLALPEKTIEGAK